MSPLKYKVKDSKLRKLAISIGVIFFYFGLLKFFPNYSPAEDLGISTIHALSAGLLPDKVSIILLAIMEVGIGLCLIFNLFTRTVIIVTISHLILTFTPFLFFPDLTFQGSYVSPSLLGQYIFKNIIIIMALWAIYPNPKTLTA